MTGRLDEQLNGNGTLTDYTYDADGNLLHLLNRGPNNVILSRFDFTYDALGRRTSVTTTDGITTFGYDADGQLTSVSLPGGRVITYQYDAGGNRTSVTDTSATTSYAANNMDQYTSAGGTTYRYDADGNLIQSTGPGGTTSYNYDARGRLIGVTSPTDTWTYEYDVFGNRIAETHNGVTTQDLVDPSGDIIAEYGGDGSLIASYTQGLGLTSRVSASGQADYYSFDATGNTVDLTGPDGAVLDSYSYLPFGETLSTSGTAPNPFTFGGQLGGVSEGDGLIKLGVRSYDPAQGRFIQKDPIGLVGGKNLYAYADNNPVSISDPSGQAPIIIPPPELIAQWMERAAQMAANSIEGWAAEGVELTAEQAAAIEAETVATTVNASWQVFVQNASGYFAEQFAQNGVVFGEAATQPVAVVEQAAQAAVEEVAEGAAEAAAESTVAAAEEAAVAGVGPTGTLLGLGVILGLAGLIAEESVVRALLIGHLPPCNPDLPDALNFIMACDNTPTITTANLKIAGSTKTEQLKPDTDPNFLAGPAGTGAANDIPSGALLPYVVDFENEPNVDLPAQVVTVSEQIDPALDWSTFQLGSFGFGNIEIQVPPGLQSYKTRVDARSSVGVYVDVDAEFNPSTGRLTWTFTSIDPTTLDVPTGNIQEGFLPPDVTAPQGDGWISYSIEPKASLETGTAISAQASVVFDTNAPVITNTYTNTIDAGSPTSTVAALPAASSSRFNVSWSGSDDAGGSGIATYSVYVSDNGGPYTLWQDGTTATSATYNGLSGHTYSFFSVATDDVGNIQPAPTSAQTTTRIDATPPHSSLTALPVFSTATFTVAWSGSDDAGGSGIATYSVFVSDNGGAFTPFVTGTTKTSMRFTGVPSHSYGFYSIATDNAGNVQPVPAAAQTTTRVDATPPTSTVTALPESSPAEFTVSWSGTDNAGGSGISSYSVYVSDNGGPFTLWQSDGPITSATYPGAAGHTYGFFSVATDKLGNAQPAPSAPQATTTVMLSAPPPPLVTVTKVLLTLNKKLQVARITVDMSGSFGAAAADSLAAYHLTIAGKRGSFTAKNAKQIKLKSAVCNASTNSIALTPKKPFALTTPVQLRISGLGSTGLTDSLGHLIDGNHDGQPGGDAIAILSKKGAITAVAVPAGPLARLAGKRKAMFSFRNYSNEALNRL